MLLENKKYLRFPESRDPLCSSKCTGYKKIGNPIIFPVKILKMILRDIDAEDRDTGLKSIIKKYNPITVKASKGVLKDFDKLEDYY